MLTRKYLQGVWKLNIYEVINTIRPKALEDPVI